MWLADLLAEMLIQRAAVTGEVVSPEIFVV